MEELREIRVTRETISIADLIADLSAFRKPVEPDLPFY